MSMNSLSGFIGSVLLVCQIPFTALAQNNYVSTSPSVSSPGSDNTLIGVGAGNANMSGAGNLIIGRAAGVSNMGGTKNAFLGWSAGQANASGYSNAFVGYGTGFTNSTGYQNTFIGSESGYTNSIGTNNLFVGFRTGYFNATGSNNSFIGTGAGYNNTAGAENVFIGADAGGSNTTGNRNIFIGSLAGTANLTGEQNTVIGYQAGNKLNSTANTFFGYRAGASATTGNFNSFIGVQAGTNTTTGNANYMFGTNSGFNNTTGSGNYFLGDNAGYYNTTGGFNVYIGANAANGSGVNGSNNVAIGFESGQLNVGGATNMFLGFRADAGANNLQNAVAIGANARVSASNAIVLGGTGANAVNVGIGTVAPANRLEVVSSTAGTSGLRLTSLAGVTSTSVSASRFLTINAQGDVVLANYTAGARTAITDNLWQVSGNLLKNSNTGGVVIGSDINKLPANYNLYVSKGILTEKVKVAVKNTSEWSDYVFAPNYKLRSLREVENFVKRNKHLPDVPSAEEVVKEGVDMARMDARLLAKIEELTLYVIKQQKQIEQLQLENRKIRQHINKRH